MIRYIYLSSNNINSERINNKSSCTIDPMKIHLNKDIINTKFNNLNKNKISI